MTMKTAVVGMAIRKAIPKRRAAAGKNAGPLRGPVAAAMTTMTMIAAAAAVVDAHRAVPATMIAVRADGLAIPKVIRKRLAVVGKSADLRHAPAAVTTMTTIAAAAVVAAGARSRKAVPAAATMTRDTVGGSAIRADMLKLPGAAGRTATN
jgi:hypothetical protein